MQPPWNKHVDTPVSPSEMPCVRVTRGKMSVLTSWHASRAVKIQQLLEGFGGSLCGRQHTPRVPASPLPPQNERTTGQRQLLLSACLSGRSVWVDAGLEPQGTLGPSGTGWSSLQPPLLPIPPSPHHISLLLFLKHTGFPTPFLPGAT